MPPSSEAVGRSSVPVIAQMSAMMFVQYWSLGLWWVTVANFIAANTLTAGEGIFSAGFLGYSQSASAIGSLAAPMLFGWIADRLFSPERLLVLLHGVAALTLWWMTVAGTQTLFFAALVLYFQAYAPTAALTNTIALGRLRDSDREFPVVRLFGTVGWIAAGVAVGVVVPWALGRETIEPTRLPLKIAAWSHLVMVVFSLTLPPTKPQAAPRESRRSRLYLLRNPTFATFLLVSMLVAATTQAYPLAVVFLDQLGYRGGVATLTIGQVTEVACLAALPWLLPRCRLKWVFLAGILCWAARFTLLAAGSLGGPDSAAWLAVLGAIVVHGPAYVFVYLVGQMYVDRLVGPSSRGLAQGLHSVATNGIGHLVGAGLIGVAAAVYLTPDGVDPPPYNWVPFWLAPVVPCLASAVLFWFCFNDVRTDQSAEHPAREPSPELGAGLPLEGADNVPRDPAAVEPTGLRDG